MRDKIIGFVFFLVLTGPWAFAQNAVVDSPAPAESPASAVSSEYILGVDDVLGVSVLQPDKLDVIVTVSPDGSITFPYVGTVPVKGLTMAQVQESIRAKLADGYMKYPVVSVSLKESRSKKFFVYGEVNKPGTYIMEDNMSVLRAISIAGGFTKFGSSSNVKVLRPKKNAGGYDAIKVNIKAIMAGDAKVDIPLGPDDIVVVSEGVF
jgi:polysaccharide export outer membrane protein